MLWPKWMNVWEDGTLRLSRMGGRCPFLLAEGSQVQENLFSSLVIQQVFESAKKKKKEKCLN